MRVRLTLILPRSEQGGLHHSTIKAALLLILTLPFTFLGVGGAAFEGVAHLRAECFVAAHEVL
jgi:hypothetical protein